MCTFLNIYNQPSPVSWSHLKPALFMHLFPFIRLDNWKCIAPLPYLAGLNPFIADWNQETFSSSLILTLHQNNCYCAGDSDQLHLMDRTEYILYFHLRMEAEGASKVLYSIHRNETIDNIKNMPQFNKLIWRLLQSSLCHKMLRNP
jgi:hypothetical protein